jgi:hypothetical protein
VKKRLIAELQSAHAWIVALGDREIQSAVRGDIACDSNLTASLEHAGHVRQTALQPLREHLAEHRCWENMEAPTAG